MFAKLRPYLLGLLLIVVVAMAPFRPLKVSGISMEPTLRDGETYLLDHLYWRLGGVRRGDIVVVKHGEEKWVKRLVGMPRDRLQIGPSCGLEFLPHPQAQAKLNRLGEAVRTYRPKKGAR